MVGKTGDGDPEIWLEGILVEVVGILLPVPWLGWTVKTGTLDGAFVDGSVGRGVGIGKSIELGCCVDGSRMVGPAAIEGFLLPPP